MITLHPAAKPFGTGFLPMITLRGDKGRMLGCKAPQGDAREFRTFTTADAAREAAQAIARRCAAQYPGILRAAH